MKLATPQILVPAAALLVAGIIGGVVYTNHAAQVAQEREDLISFCAHDLIRQAPSMDPYDALAHCIERSAEWDID